MYTLKQFSKPVNRFAYICGAIFVLLSFYWLFALNSKSEGTEISTAPERALHIALPDTAQLSKATEHIRDYYGIAALTLETFNVPVTDFSEVLILPYKAVIQRLIPDDPRNSRLLQYLPRIFSVTISGKEWQQAFYPAELASHITQLESEFEAMGLEWRHNLSYLRTAGLFWMIPIGYFFFNIITQYAGQDLLFRIAMQLGWLLFGVISGSWQGSLAALFGLYLSSALVTICPAELNQAKRFACRLVLLQPWLKKSIPFGIGLLIVLLTHPFSLFAALVPLAGNMLLLRYGHHIHKLDANHYLHRKPNFLPIREPVTAYYFPQRYSLYALSLIFLVAVVGLESRVSFRTDRNLPSGRTMPVASLSAAFEDHSFLQLALTQGILGSLDSSALSFQTTETIYVNGKPRGIQPKTVTRQDSAEALAALSAASDLASLSRLHVLETAESQTKISRQYKKTGQALDMQGYVLCIMLILLLIVLDLMQGRFNLSYQTKMRRNSE